MNQRVALVVAATGSFLHPFMVAALTVALPSIGREFSMDPVLLGWVVTAYLLSAAMFLIPLGKAADIYGRRRIFAWGVVVYTLFSALCSLTTSATQLIAFRVLQGIGITMVFGTAVAILASAFPAGERGRAFGINLAVTYLALAVGPIVGGFLTERFGWRSVFLVNLPVGLALAALVFWKLEGDWAEAKGEKFDSVGSLLYGLALVALMYGVSLLPAWSGAIWALGGVLGLAAFVWWETRSEHPVLNIDLFRKNALFASSNLSALVFYASTSAVPFLLTLHLQYVEGLSPQQTGWVLVAQPIMMTVFSPVAGRLSDRIQPGIVASSGLVLVASGLLILAYASGQPGLVWTLVGLLVLGFGYALFSSPNTNAGMGAVESRFYGVASAALSTMRLTGQMFSMGLAMLALAVIVGKVQITPELYPSFVISMRIVFVVSALLCAVGIATSLAGGRAR